MLFTRSYNNIRLLTRGVFTLLSIVIIHGCALHYGDEHTPTWEEDGVFSFEYKGERYHQVNSINELGARAICHHDLDTLVIYGYARVPKKEKYGNSKGCKYSKMVFIIPLDKINDDMDVHFEKDGVIFKEISNWKFFSCDSAVIHFDNKLDVSMLIHPDNYIEPSDREGNQFISGTFSVAVNGETLDNGLFKMCVVCVNTPFSPGMGRPDMDDFGYNLVYLFNDSF